MTRQSTVIWVLYNYHNYHVRAFHTCEYSCSKEKQNQKRGRIILEFFFSFSVIQCNGATWMTLQAWRSGLLSFFDLSKALAVSNQNFNLSKKKILQMGDNKSLKPIPVSHVTNFVWGSLRPPLTSIQRRPQASSPLFLVISSLPALAFLPDLIYEKPLLPYISSPVLCCPLFPVLYSYIALNGKKKE